MITSITSRENNFIQFILRDKQKVPFKALIKLNISKVLVSGN